MGCEDHVCKDDASAKTRWRLSCASGTVGRWWVREIEFHGEGMCFEAHNEYRRALSSGTFNAGHDAAKAFDGDPSTYWGSLCNQCKPDEAWIGVDFGKPQRVACVRLIQD